MRPPTHRPIVEKPRNSSWPWRTPTTSVASASSSTGHSASFQPTRATSRFQSRLSVTARHASQAALPVRAIR